MSRIKIVLVVVAMVVLSLSFASAADISWVGTTGYWTNSANWNPNIPALGDDLYITNGGAVTIDGPYNGKYIHVGTKAGTTGTLNIVSSTNSSDYGTDDNTYYLGDKAGGSCTLNQSGGSVRLSYIYMGKEGGTCTYNLSGGSLRSESGFYCGWGTGKAYFNQTGGTNIIDFISLSRVRFSPGVGIYTISGGRITTESSEKGTIYFSSSAGQFKVIGGNAEINFVAYLCSGDSYTPTQTSEINASGLSTITVSGDAELQGTWNILDSGAEKGRYDILTAGASITTNNLTVNLPNVDEWSWGIDTHSAPKKFWVNFTPPLRGTVVTVQ